MQGQPIGGSYQGTKNTSDSLSNDPIREGAGGVASDSLAAESYRQGGDFSQNRNAAPSSVSGSSVTWNTTDTQSAERLDSTTDAASRDPDRPQRYPEALGGQGSFPGGHNVKDGYVGGPSGSSAYNSGTGGNSRDDDYRGSSGAGVSSSNAGTAPNYTLNQQGAFQDSKPKGKNLTEGGFSGEGTNYNSGIGTRDDPGRAALKDFEKRDARADPGNVAQMGGPDRHQPYGSLDRDERA